MIQFLGQNIRYLRKQYPVTQSQLAALVGKGQTTIGNWENGISEPNIEELLILSNYFDISLDVLIRVDLGKTNYQLEKRRVAGKSLPTSAERYGGASEKYVGSSEKYVGSAEKYVGSAEKYVGSAAESVSVVKEQGAEDLSYVLREIKALREEVERIGALLPEGTGAAGAGGGKEPTEGAGT